MLGVCGAIALGAGTHSEKQVPTYACLPAGAAPGLTGEPGSYWLEMLIASHHGGTLMSCSVPPLAAAGVL